VPFAAPQHPDATGRQQTGCEEVARRCTASVDSSGYGSAFVTQDLTLSHVTGEITVPCRIYLRNGAKLTITSLHLNTRSLAVTDGPVVPLMGSGAGNSWSPAVPASPEASATPSLVQLESSLSIEHSSLTGVGNAGLVVMLGSKYAIFRAQDAYVDYSMGVRVTLGAALAAGLCDRCRPPAEQGGGSIDVRDSTIRSVGSGTQGIFFSTTYGPATFVDDHVEDGSARGGPLLLSFPCHAQGVANVGPDCQVPGSASKKVLTGGTPYPTPSNQ
jgi:hypothetical protein